MSGYLLRKDQAHDRLAQQRCNCGHPLGEHHLLRDIWNPETGEFERNPDYGAFSFHCDQATCDCVVVSQ